MERSRSKRYYYDQDYESETLHSRNKPRYGGSNSYGGGGGGGGGGGRYAPSYHRRSSSAATDGGGRKMDPSLMVTTSYRILCHDVKAGGVIGKSGSIIKAIRQHTGAWINVHEVIPGDEERIIEISDTRRRDPDGRIPSFSPAQEALFLIHERILETEMVGGGFGPMVEEEYDDYGGGRGGNGNKVVTRLVVSRMHVGSLLGKGGKIIEQMRMETKTHIRILPRDHTLPRCIAMSEEIVQIVGDMNAVKNAVSIISSRLRESQHRDRTNFQNRLHSPDRFFPDDDFHGNNPSRRPSLDRPNYGSRYSSGPRSNNRPSRPSGYAGDHGPAPASDNAQSFSWEDLVFRILCPVGKLDSVVGETDGIVDLLQNEIGVNVDVTEKVAGSDEHIIIVSSDEGPDDELFPAQEALLHIQTRIADLLPDKENIVTTRLLLQSDEIGCLGLKDGLLELGKVGGVKIVLLSREELPEGISGQDEILQIVGEIKSSREALLEVTSRVRSYIYREFLDKEAPGLHVSAPSPVVTTKSKEPVSDNVPPQETKVENGPAVLAQQETLAAEVTPKVKDTVLPVVETVKQNESERREEPQPSGLNKIAMKLVTRSTLEVVIPPHAATQLATKSRKLALISDLSGASVKLIDDKPDSTEKIIQISGTPEQAERAQSLLQGFILSTEEDGP